MAVKTKLPRRGATRTKKKSVARVDQSRKDVGRNPTAFHLMKQKIIPSLFVDLAIRAFKRHKSGNQVSRHGLEE